MLWQLRDQDLKRYPHFDPVITADMANSLVVNEGAVARHAFYPFIKYEQRWKPFSKGGAGVEEKVREIRYAARADAYIYAYYRHTLKERYEKILQDHYLTECVLAYRRIVDPATGVGKCNIEFAHDAFGKIRFLGNCTVIALDISAFFESIDHAKLKKIWCRILDVSRLPIDHFNVFKTLLHTLS